MVFGRTRRRLDALRQRYERSHHQPALSTGEAIDRLRVAIDAHVGAVHHRALAADRLTRALDLVPVGLVLMDARGELAFRNRSASKYFDARHGNALVGSAINEMLADALEGDPGTRTVDLFGPPRRNLLLKAVPLDDAGAPAGAFLVLEDVSERTRLDAVRRDFVANISHELKTPIGALSVLAETLVDETDPVVAQRLARRVSQEAYRVAGTIDDLLELSRIESANQPEMELIEVAAVVAEVLDRVSHAAEVAEVKVIAHDPPTGLTVRGDRRQLVSALANLCDNAIKYSDAGQTVGIHVDDLGDQVAIDVVDQGIGIPAADHDRIFERFYRVDRARSRDTGGTGLGLAIVNHVVQNHGGRITVSSFEGEGSSFSLKLPVVGREGDTGEGP